MEIVQGFGAKGFYEIVNDETGEIIAAHNVITTGLFTAILNNLNNTATGFAITKLAAGTGTNTAAFTDTALQTQIAEKAITSSSITTTQYKCKIILAPSEFVGNIKEMGMFAGSTLISRVNVDFPKNSSTQYTVNFTLTLQ